MRPHFFGVKLMPTFLQTSRPRPRTAYLDLYISEDFNVYHFLYGSLLLTFCPWPGYRVLQRP